jgi:transposase
VQEHAPKRLSEMVVKRQRDGRRRFDPQAKRALIEACLKPGVSVAGLALEHGVNANLLRKWVSQHQRAHGNAVARRAAVPRQATAFIPVVTVGAPSTRQAHRVRAKLPNGIEVDLGETNTHGVSSLLHLLNGLPCSGSRRG